MKKYTCLALVLLVSFLLISCGKGVSIDSGNLTQTTVALMKDGSSEMGIVEDFSKDYYQMEDLEDFIHEAVNAFQEDYGKDSVELNYIEKKEQQVHVTLKFKDIEKYAAFNQEEVKLLTFSEAKAQGILPRNMEAADKSGSIGTDSIQDDSYYVAIWEGSYQLMVDGTIAYYSDGVLLNGNTIQTSGEETTVIVFG